MLQWCKPNTGLPNPIGVHLGIIQTVESRTPLLLSAYPWGKCSCKIALMLKRLGNFETRGTYAFHSAQNSRSFRGNQMDWTILVWPGQNIKLVPYDWSCWSDWNVPFHFTNIICCLHFCSSVFWLQNDHTTTKCVAALVGSVKQECLFHWVNRISEILNWNICWMESAPDTVYCWCLSAVSWVGKRF